MTTAAAAQGGEGAEAADAAEIRKPIKAAGGPPRGGELAQQGPGTTEAELLAWLRQVLAHVLAHEIRRYRGTQQRDAQREVSLDQSLAASATRLRNMLVSPGTSPSVKAAGNEQEVILADVLSRLPADYRQVIILRNLQGLSHEEVARRMGRGTGAVRMLWVRALARLRDDVRDM